MNEVTQMALILVGIGLVGFVACWVLDKVIEHVRRKRRFIEAVIRIKTENEMLKRENRHLKLISDVREYYDCFIK